MEERDWQVVPGGKVNKLIGEMGDEGELSKTGTKIAILVILSIFTVIAVIAIIQLSADRHELQRKEEALSQQIREEQAKQAELQSIAEELCLDRAQEYTADGSLAMNDFLKSYGYAQNGDSFSDGAYILSFTDGDITISSADGRWTRALDKASSDVSYRLDEQEGHMSERDLRALGRAIVGDMSLFN